MKLLPLLLAAMLCMAPALAGPGAHGPNGEHLDGPAATGGTGVPYLETFTESFELVGRLSGGELSIMVDRYETNEPVLGADLAVQYKNLKARATFHADMGDYAVDDPKLLAAISQPGAHALSFTLVAGEESGRLEGTLQVAEPAHDHDHDDHDDHRAGTRWLLAAVAAAVVIAAAFLVRRLRQRQGA
ncbi:hypothetical protein [Massilia consociata]|uniref:Copper resistance protein CopC n=1 Tax=Massilia consociata TaxID=760117 RepID=A0ABV6FJQ0_9BURK